MNIFKKLSGKKKKERVEFPYHFIKIVWTESALHEGTLDEFNKEIQRIKGDEIYKIPYTKVDLDALVKVYQIPVIDMTKLQGEEFKFEELDLLQGNHVEVRN
ncbi:MAG: hypothetical protein PHF86_12530 [Candidatus Nanoarchaeia archaeon]|nr:hypothetical protein [Candidatus Nanoarchaeia archaeon]